MDKKFVSLFLVFFLSASIFIGFVMFNQPLTTITRAREEGAPDPGKSLVFAWPLNLKADGQAESTITIFARTAAGKNLSNKRVTVTTTVGTIREAILATDNNGKALFHLTSTTPGLAEIKIMIDNIEIQKKITVKFE